MKSACLATALIRCIVFGLLLTSISIAVPRSLPEGQLLFGRKCCSYFFAGNLLSLEYRCNTQSITVSVAGNYSVTIPGNDTSAVTTITVLQNPIAQIGQAALQRFATDR
ncbi:MAG: hypothetical protein U0X76_05100 [Bacteroidia bacterium]